MYKRRRPEWSVCVPLVSEARWNEMKEIGLLSGGRRPRGAFPRLQWTFERVGPAGAAGSAGEPVMYGKQALRESFDEMAKQQTVTLKDLQPFTAYEYLLTETQTARMQELGKELYLSATRKRQACLQMKEKEKKAKKNKTDTQSERMRVRGLFSSK